jgi:DUF4097 and DUF4098 domain-containing protein YvlB
MKKTGKIISLLATLSMAVSFVLSACTMNVVRYDKYADADLYTVGTATLSASEVAEIEIDWVDGRIEIEQTNTSTVTVMEENSDQKSVSKEAERMRYYLDGNILKVKYCQSGLRGSVNTHNKNLRVEVPQGLSIEVDSVGAGITVGFLQAEKVSVESVSGNITAERIVCNKAEIETVSGKTFIGELIANAFSFEGVSGKLSVTKLSTEELDVETLSGNVEIGVHKALIADVESTSADVAITLGEGLGAVVRMETSSGKLITEKNYAKTTGSRYDIFGADGVSTDCKIDVDIISGNVYIR